MQCIQGPQGPPCVWLGPHVGAEVCFHTNGVPLSYGPFGPILRVGPYAATSARSFVSWHLAKAYPGRTPNLRLFTGRENWDLCGMALSPHRCAGPVRHHHGRRRFRISRVGCIVAASTCEHAARTRTEQHGRMRPWASALCRTGRRHVMHGLEPVHAHHPRGRPYLSRGLHRRGQHPRACCERSSETTRAWEMAV